MKALVHLECGGGQWGGSLAGGDHAPGSPRILLLLPIPLSFLVVGLQAASSHGGHRGGGPREPTWHDGHRERKMMVVRQQEQLRANVFDIRFETPTENQPASQSRDLFEEKQKFRIFLILNLINQENIICSFRFLKASKLWE